jgi:hypothetical protein
MAYRSLRVGFDIVGIAMIELPSEARLALGRRVISRVVQSDYTEAIV